MIVWRTDVGVMAEEIVASGALLPDDVMLRVIAEKLDKLHNKVCRRNTLVNIYQLSYSTGFSMAFHAHSVKVNCWTGICGEQYERVH